MEIWWGFFPLMCFVLVQWHPRTWIFHTCLTFRISNILFCIRRRRSVGLPVIRMGYLARGRAAPSSYPVKDASLKGIPSLSTWARARKLHIKCTYFVSADNRIYFLTSYPSWIWHLWSVKSMQMLLKLNKYHSLVFHIVTFLQQVCNEECEKYSRLGYVTKKW